MKTKLSLLCLAFMLTSLIGFSQFKLEVGAIGTMPGNYYSEQIIDLGYGVYIEPKYKINDKFEVGVKIEGIFTNASLLVDLNNDISEFRFISVTTKFNYLFSGKKLTPFVGIGIGAYQVHMHYTSIDRDINYVDMGISPEFGIKYGDLSISTSYIILSPNSDAAGNVSGLLELNIGFDFNLEK